MREIIAPTHFYYPAQSLSSPFCKLLLANTDCLLRVLFAIISLIVLETINHKITNKFQLSGKYHLFVQVVPKYQNIYVTLFQIAFFIQLYYYKKHGFTTT